MIVSRILFCTCMSALVPGSRAPDAAAEEPPLQLVLELAGKEIPLQLGQPLQVEIDGKPRSLRLRALDHRVFEYEGLSFHYPSYFNYEFDDEDPGTWIWTLEGPDALLMVQRFGPSPPDRILAILERSISSNYKKCTLSDTQVTLNGRTLKGRSLNIQILDHQMRQDLFCFASGEYTYALLFQDVLTDSGETTTEMRFVMELLNQSLTW
jgi:hypothetical protein